MFRTRFVANVIGNLSLIAVVIGGLMFATSGIDLALWRDGRLTDFACYLFLAALVAGVAGFARFDYLASHGRLSTRTLPLWLRDAHDPR